MAAVTQNGFTIIELLLTMTLLAILSSIAIPSLHQFFKRQAQAQILQQLSALLRYARQTAMVEHQPVLVCGSAAHHVCDGQWSAGQMVRVGTRVLRVSHRSVSFLKISFHNSFGKNTQLSFLPNGFTNGDQGSFYVCDQRHTMPCARLIVMHSGFVR